MKKVYDIYLQLLRTALWSSEQQPLPELTAGELQQLVAINMQQKTAPLVFPQLLADEHADVQTKPLRMHMQAACVQTMQHQVRLQQTLQQVWTVLQDAGIQPVLLKGASLAALYREPQLRAWGDIDLFVGKKRYHEACDALRKAFPDAEELYEEEECYKHYNLVIDGVMIELHHVTSVIERPIDKWLHRKIERRGMAPERLRHIQLNGFDVVVPEPTFYALFVFMHSWEHLRNTGVLLRQLCDLALLLHHYGNDIDRKQLRHDLRLMNLTKLWQIYMFVLVNNLGLPKEEAPFYSDACSQRAEVLLTDMLGGKIEIPAHEQRTFSNRLLRKIYTMQCRMKEAERIGRYNPAYAFRKKIQILLHGATRLFAKDTVKA